MYIYIYISKPALFGKTPKMVGLTQLQPSVRQLHCWAGLGSQYTNQQFEHDEFRFRGNAFHQNYTH